MSWKIVFLLIYFYFPSHQCLLTFTLRYSISNVDSCISAVSMIGFRLLVLSFNVSALCATVLSTYFDTDYAVFESCFLGMYRTQEATTSHTPVVKDFALILEFLRLYCYGICAIWSFDYRWFRIWPDLHHHEHTSFIIFQKCFRKTFFLHSFSTSCGRKPLLWCPARRVQLRQKSFIKVVLPPRATFQEEKSTNKPWTHENTRNETLGHSRPYSSFQFADLIVDHSGTLFSFNSFVAIPTLTLEVRCIDVDIVAAQRLWWWG